MMHIDSFSGAASDLRAGRRTSANVLAVLAKSPRVSTWDMSEHHWLRSCIADLKTAGLIRADDSAPYPWHRYVLTAAGIAHLAPPTDSQQERS